VLLTVSLVLPKGLHRIRHYGLFANGNEPNEAVGGIGGIWIMSLLDLGGASEPRGLGGPHRRNRHGLRRGCFRRIRGRRAVAADVIGPREGVSECRVHRGDLRRKPSEIRDPRDSLRGKRICVTGKISEYQGKPEIVLTDPSQLTQ
jgi:hypothetical protein